MANKRKKKSDNSGDEGDKSDASERRGRRTRWWSLRSRSGPGGGSEAELGEGRPRPRLRSPPPPQPEEHNTQHQQHTHQEDSDDDDDDQDDPNIDPTTATNTISNTNIPTTAPPPPPPPPPTTTTTTRSTRSTSTSQLPPSDIYSHSLIAPPRPRQTVNRKFWDIIHRRQSSKRTSRSSPPPHTANDHEDPEYRSFDAAKTVRPPPRVVEYLPKPSERAAKFGTPPSILKESGGPRRLDFPLPAPTEAERNWRHTISRIPGAVAGAVLKERASVDFDKKSRVHGYFQSDPIYLTENTTPERRPSPPPIEHSLSEYLDSLGPSDQAKAKSNKDDNNNNNNNNNKDNQNPQLNYSSLFDEFQGENLPAAAPGTPRRRRSVVFVEPEVPLNRRSLRPRPSSGPATAATAATTALAQIKAQQQQASSSSRGNPGSSSSSSGNKKSTPSKKGSKGKKGPKDTKTNPRGIPEAPFIENVEDFVTSKQEIEPAIRKFSEMIAKYTYMMESNARRAAGLKDKIPDIKKTLQMVQFLETKNKKGDEEPISTMFELSDTLYAKASVTPPSEVYLWLGVRIFSSSSNFIIPKSIYILTGDNIAGQRNVGIP
ncbi:hypothetical protein TWF788_002763 [Orbilia oligospora]|uniref:Uncharacterized protein n=1 Tax=Orbilia oligospora TaxID=2813651 RepID=A0A7C8KAL0_ORBOL|nr:hypothetical protein TWF788_002763 [Orbilia oligospora]